MNTPNRNRRRGKQTERVVAKLIGGKRIGILGNDDVQTTHYSVEVKDKNRFVGQKIMAQAIRNCPEGKTPISIVHITGTNHLQDDIVMLMLRDWLDLVGKG